MQENTAIHSAPDLEARVLDACCFDAPARKHAVLNLTARDFYDPRHRELWGTIEAMERDGDEPDYAVAASRAGMSVAELVALMPTDRDAIAWNVPRYCERLRDFTALRESLSVVEDIVVRARSASTPDEGNRLLAALGEALKGTLAPVKVDCKDAMTSARELWDALNSPQETQRQPLTTGIASLDRVLDGGFRPGQLVIIGARPGCGKSSLAINRLTVSAAEAGKRVLVFSLEMATGELTERIIASRSHTLLSVIRRRAMSDEQRSDVNTSISDLSEFDLHFNDKRGLTVMEIVKAAHNLHGLAPLDLVVVDYLQIVRGVTRKGGTREQEVAEITRELKTLAGDMKCPVVACSQLNRQGEEGVPRLSDLRESGALEQDADIVLLLAPTSAPANEKVVDIPCIVAKHRGGATGRVKLLFDRPHTAFNDGGAWDEPPEDPRKGRR